MARIEVQTKVLGRDSEALLTEHVPPAMLADPAPAAPVRSMRRATARRASNRRATARSHQSDTDASIIGFLARHAESTAGDLAKGLNLSPGSVSARLTHLAKAGEIMKASHGFSTKQVARPST
jgi:hypothetical protein